MRYIHEDQLPLTLTDEEYSAWFAQSWIEDGVRVGPKVEDIMSEKVREVLKDAIRQHVEQNELQPCPFCGNQPNCFQVRDDRYVEGEMNWVIECKDMGCIFRRSSPDRSIDNLIANWNKRAGFWWA